MSVAETRRPSESSAEPGLPSPNTPRTDSISVSDYRPMRALLFWILVSAGIVVLIGVSRLGENFSAVGKAVGIGADLKSQGILMGIWVRSLADPYCKTMLVGGLAVLLYLVAQGVALQRETAALAAGTGGRAAGLAPEPSMSTAASFLARVSGRPPVHATLLATSRTHISVGIDLEE